jgi:diaminopimelate decarboxylase
MDPGVQVTDTSGTVAEVTDMSGTEAATTSRAAPSAERDVRGHCHGMTRLDARLEPWQVALCGEPDRLHDLVATYGSPVNVHSTAPFARNVARLQQVAAARHVPFEILFARKADKALAYVDAARELGIGVDTASEEELTQVLARDVDPARVVTTAAIKTDALLRAAIAAGVTVVLDNDDELDRVCHLAEAAGVTVPIALRFGGFHLDGGPLSTRFGFEVARGQALGAQLAGDDARRVVRLEGVHFHLDGYEVAHRIAGVAQLLPLIDTLREQGHPIRHLDIGGGLPMSYVDDAGQWSTFARELLRALLGDRPPITYANNGLGLFVHDGQVHGALALYPYHQQPTAPGWLAQLLDARLASASAASGSTSASGSVADGLRARGLTLRCEPGRSLLDGCGLTIARVEHRKRHADGSWSVGVAMNRTQCATGKADHTVDPLLVPGTDPSATRTGPIEGHLMGAYCTESDLLTWRRLRFPTGVARGDVVVFPNTAGYLMHFVESRSHRFPLAANVVLDERRGAFALDAIDGDADRA